MATQDYTFKANFRNLPSVSKDMTRTFWYSYPKIQYLPSFRGIFERRKVYLGVVDRQQEIKIRHIKF